MGNRARARMNGMGCLASSKFREASRERQKHTVRGPEFESQASAGGLTTEDAEETEESQGGSRVRDMAEEWGQEHGRVPHSFVLALVRIDKTRGQSLWL
ncbi:MAG: hypothetical protein JNL58_04090 [Planctomyces sp.]|nr:hypothetical protein [Planctomyces sp.]